jgi:hypothetical protein
MPATPRNRTDACSGVADVPTVSPVEVDVRGLDGPATLRARWTDLGESASGDPA